jgi:hypothetical protein
VIEQARNLAKTILAIDQRLEQPHHALLKAELQLRSAHVAIRAVI